MLSKLALEDIEILPAPPGAWFPAQRCSVRAAFGTVQILNVHLRPALEAGSWIQGFFTTPPLRRREIEAHWHALAHDRPTVIAGDFNEDATGLALELLAGHGFARVPTTGPTSWHYEEDAGGAPWDLLKMDIDHVVVGPQLTGSDGVVLDVAASDHRPVLATIAPV